LADTDKECRFGIIRGGSFLNLVERSSVTVRAGRPRSGGATNMGFRVALGAGKDAIAVVAAENWVEEPPLDNSPGAALFTDNCAACHRNARGFEGLYGKDQNSLVTAIRDGGNNVMSMPAFADRLSDAEIATVADYLRATNNWD
jgi:mono/diheme cytochrome c family protein